MTSKLSLKHIGGLIIGLKVSLVLFLLLKVFVFPEESFQLSLSSDFFIFMLAGFLAQLIDGALGMAYGVSCTTFLLNFGVPPAIASASVHTAEVFTTGVSGLSHLFLKNVNMRLFLKLAIPGVLGAVVGAYLVSAVFDGGVLKPYISAYLMLIGVVLLVKSFKAIQSKQEAKRVSLLGVVGGFCDAIGGGGWGPIVTSNLIMQGKTPKETIGTVNTAEFFVTFFSTGVFLFIVGVDSWQVVLGLIAGGVIAAPFGALMSKRIQPKTLMRLVGVIIILTSSYTIFKALL
ncbi:sulfite exporter TauE/SafE family protein [Pontibacter harenae]|uniref:sulfite exporter TauE/SafE family protein n=1 Tax=Pontibacter harenae TaxID=2894083 RepID=UPI001E4FD1BD|nr:sulfite exporter TauE/SafE family protein [Pontibacter harenae]MCC9166308.1 sulfite exporter TauE/SafE family protein [Pontibacter harenae]